MEPLEAAIILALLVIAVAAVRHLFMKSDDVSAPDSDAGEKLEAADDQSRHEHIRNLRQQILEDQEAKVEDFCLLLRSSRADAKLSAPYFPEGTISDRYSSGDPELYRFRRYLYSRMQPVVVRAIKNDTAIEELVAFDYGEDWKRGVLKDMESCAFMLAIPMYPTDALRWELNTILSRDWNRRLYFVMPPLGSLRPKGIESLVSLNLLMPTSDIRERIAHSLWSSDFTSTFWEVEMMEAWIEGLETLFNEFGIYLGSYNKRGGLFMHRSALHWDLYLKWEQLNGNILRAGAQGKAVFRDFRIESRGDA